MRLRITVLLLFGCTPIAFAQVADFSDIDFAKADSIALIYHGAKLRHPEKLAQSLTRDLSTEVEKFRAIFRWITNDISYDVKLYHKSLVKNVKFKYKPAKLKRWNKKFSNLADRHSLNRKRSICHGYAMLVENMCNSVGLQSNIISGYGRTTSSQIGRGQADHAWNVVKLGMKWYLADATWASGYVDDDLGKFFRHYRNDYFLADPDLFIANHFPKDTTWILKFDKPTLKEFLSAPLKSSGYLTSKISNYAPQQGMLRVKTGESICFTFSQNASKNVSAHLVAAKQGSDHSFTGDFSRSEEGGMELNQVFETKGIYEVDIYINRKHVFTYIVSVH
jgi:hypothetical protein